MTDTSLTEFSKAVKIIIVYMNQQKKLQSEFIKTKKVYDKYRKEVFIPTIKKAEAAIKKYNKER